MQRRTLFTSAFSSSTRGNSTALNLANNDLSPYLGQWTSVEAAHLLRRTTFGFNYKDLVDHVDMGMAEAVLQLTKDLPSVDPPINYDFESDPDVPLGSTWINAPYDAVNRSNNYRIRSLLSWTMQNLAAGEMNVREKMTLFWHNHFVTAGIGDARFRYKYISLFRSNPMGNFRDLVKEITIDPSMLRYLNGRQNSRFSPNENYARELLELFTIGKGPLAGPGDYTNYTEEDVRAISRILTGWRDTGYNNVNGVEVGSVYVDNRHDKDEKKLSNRLGDVVFNNDGDQEYINLIDAIFQQDEVSRFISRKLYRWFVYYKIDDAVEQTIIEPMAQIIRDNDYSIKEALIALLSSNHFYNSEQIGCMIKNPIDFLTGLMVSLEMNNSPEEQSAKYNYWLRVSNSTRSLQMQYYDPPSVAGWSPYHQEPSYYQAWLNSVTLPLRQSTSDSRIQRGIILGDFRARANFLELIKQFPKPNEVINVIEDFITLLLPKALTDDQINALKEILIPGLPNFEWTVEYELHIQDPNDTALAESLNNRLRDMVLYISRMPEYQLS